MNIEAQLERGLGIMHLSSPVTAMQEGRVGDARNIHVRLNELFQLIFVDGNPSGIKALMEILGMLENNLRLPLVPACDDTYSDLQQAITFL